MANFTRNGSLIQIGDDDTIGSKRIEPGPVKKTAKATKELLSNDVTADHYFAGQRQIGEDADGNPIMHTGVDADGRTIEEGAEINYLDWLGHQRGEEGCSCFYLYQLRERTAAEKKALEIEGPSTVWAEVGQFPTEDEAISAALAL